VGPSGSEATGWHHYDGAREITLGAVSGDDGNGHEHDAVSMPHRREGFTLTPQKRPGPVVRVSCEAVRELLRIQCGVAMPIRTVGEHPRRWGFTPQKPVKRI
jgi:hypothetical protein